MMISAKLYRVLTFLICVALPVPVAAQDRPAGTAVKDAWITTQVQAKYFGDDVVKGRNIDVDTRNGVVTLTGAVTNAAERQRAVARAREVDGVVRVEDRLTIGAVGKTESKAGKVKDRTAATGEKAGTALDRLEKEISDGWITTKVQSKFYLDDTVKGLQIDVATNGGVVTLTGKVGSAAERQQALSLAKSTDGVKQVIDKLTVGK
jgi:hyperosmotically inducible protein